MKTKKVGKSNQIKRVNYINPCIILFLLLAISNYVDWVGILLIIMLIVYEISILHYLNNVGGTIWFFYSNPLEEIFDKNQDAEQALVMMQHVIRIKDFISRFIPLAICINIIIGIDYLTVNSGYGRLGWYLLAIFINATFMLAYYRIVPVWRAVKEYTNANHIHFRIPHRNGEYENIL